jgi:hypothetical protein
METEKQREGCVYWKQHFNAFISFIEMRRRLHRGLAKQEWNNKFSVKKAEIIIGRKNDIC